MKTSVGWCRELVSCLSASTLTLHQVSDHRSQLIRLSSAPFYSLEIKRQKQLPGFTLKNDDKYQVLLSILMSPLFQAVCPSYWVVVWKAQWLRALWAVFFFIAEWEHLKVHLQFSFTDTNSVWQSAPKRTIYQKREREWARHLNVLPALNLQGHF